MNNTLTTMRAALEFAEYIDSENASQEVIDRSILVARTLTALIASMEAQPEPTGVFGFLLGRNALDGAWYGEIPEGKTRYWWRQALIDALYTHAASQPASQPVSQRNKSCLINN